MASRSPEELDELYVIPALKRGDRTWIADHIRKGGELTPRLRKLFLDLVEKNGGGRPIAIEESKQQRNT
jgi:hypothetical protein